MIQYNKCILFSSFLCWTTNIWCLLVEEYLSRNLRSLIKFYVKYTIRQNVINQDNISLCSIDNYRIILLVVIRNSLINAMYELSNRTKHWSHLYYYNLYSAKNFIL